MDKKLHGYIAAACFGLYALLVMVWAGNWISCIAGVLIALFIVIGKTKLTAVGFGIVTLSNLWSIVSNIIYYNRYGYGAFTLGDYLLLILVGIVTAMPWIMMLITGLIPQKAKVLSIVAAALEVIFNIVTVLNFMSIVYLLLLASLCGGMVSLGFYQEKLAKQAQRAAIPAAGAAKGTLNMGNAEKLLQMKALLDKGLITQEEFDQKKKELLNL